MEISLDELVEKYGLENSTVFVEPDYKDAIVGCDKDGHIIYDYELMALSLMNEYQISYEDAIDDINYNAIRSLPYNTGPIKPFILYDISDYANQENSDCEEVLKEMLDCNNRFFSNHYYNTAIMGYIEGKNGYYDSICIKSEEEIEEWYKNHNKDEHLPEEWYVNSYCVVYSYEKMIDWVINNKKANTREEAIAFIENNLQSECENDELNPIICFSK